MSSHDNQCRLVTYTLLNIDLQNKETEEIEERNTIEQKTNRVRRDSIDGWHLKKKKHEEIENICRGV